MKSKVLVVGSGGREHALGWKLGQSEHVSEVIYAPGNGGTEEGKGRNIPIDGSKKENFPTLFDFVESENVDMVVVGPEGPLDDGIVDYFNFEDYNRVFGPKRIPSSLESDKFYSYDIMHELEIPQALSVECFSTNQAEEFIKKLEGKWESVVIKASGLTGGKGVSVCDSLE